MSQDKRYLKLKAAMKEQKKTRADCAKQLWITPSAISQKLNGKRKIDIEEACILARYLRKTLDELFMDA